MANAEISALVRHAVRCGLISREDSLCAANRLLEAMQLDEYEPAFDVTSDTGVGPDDGTKIDLFDNVVMVREETAESARLEARTDQATVFIDDKVIQTDRPVEIDLGPNRLTGTGMRLDGETRQLQVDSRVRGTLAPDAGRH